MIQGIGIDIIELDRVEALMNRKQRLMKRILSAEELQALHQLPAGNRRVEYVAGRFAAKEAFSKANGTGIGKIGFKDISIINDEKGKPSVRVDGYAPDQLFVSITHSRDYACAQVIIERP